MANALLTDANALGYVTELLSGRFQAPFGRSSHHQVWSEAMVVSPIVRGLLGIDVRRTKQGGPVVRIVPSPPADWDDFTVSNLRVGVSGGEGTTYTVRFRRTERARTFEIERSGPATTMELGLALPLDARVRSVTPRAGRLSPDTARIGDVQVATVRLAEPSGSVRFEVDEGSDVYRRIEAAQAGAESTGLRILRSRAQPGSLALRLEGRAGHRYVVHLRSPRQVGTLPEGVRQLAGSSRHPALEIAFEGPPGRYVRRDVTIPLR